MGAMRNFRPFRSSKLRTGFVETRTRKGPRSQSDAMTESPILSRGSMKISFHSGLFRMRLN